MALPAAPAVTAVNSNSAVPPVAGSVTVLKSDTTDAARAMFAVSGKAVLPVTETRILRLAAGWAFKASTSARAVVSAPASEFKSTEISLPRTSIAGVRSPLPWSLLVNVTVIPSSAIPAARPRT